MSKIIVNGCSYYYQMHKCKNSLGTIIFSHGLLWTSKIFMNQVEYLKKKYSVLIYDHRGHGQTQTTADNYDMDQIYVDTVSIIERLNLGKIHFVGMSMGSFIGMRIAARRPDIVETLTLMGASANRETRTFKYKLLITMVRLFGIKSVSKKVLKIMFSNEFIRDPGNAVERYYWTNQLIKNTRAVIPAVLGVINRKSIEAEIENIKCPTLIIVGSRDKATIPGKAEYIHKLVQHSELKYIEKAGHLTCIEAPDRVNNYIADFLLKNSPFNGNELSPCR